LLNENKSLSTDLQTSVEYLKGVGPQRAALLKKELKIHNLNDLLNYFPFRYIDRTKFNEIGKIDDKDGNVQLKGTLGSFSEMGAGRGKRLVAPLFDKTGSVELVWFKGQKWVKGSLKEGKPYIAYGKPSRFGHKYSIAHPEMELVEQASVVKGLQPVYSSGEKLMSKGLNSKGIEKVIRISLPQIKGSIAETLPEYLVKKLKLISREEAILNIHQPVSEAWMNAARFRLKFEELFILQLVLVRRKLAVTQKLPGHVLKK